MVRALGLATAVTAGVVAGVRVPELLREPEPPTRIERLVDLRQDLERQEARLPFDPDDPGPGATPIFRVSDGVIDGNLWTVAGYRDRTGAWCIQLVVASDFGRRRCLGPAAGAIRAILDVDRGHGMTLVSGMVGPEVAELHFLGPEVPLMDVTIGRENPEADEPQPGFFGIALGDEYVAVPSREAGREGGYDVLPGRLVAFDAGGAVVERMTLLLARG